MLGQISRMTSVEFHPRGWGKTYYLCCFGFHLVPLFVDLFRCCYSTRPMLVADIVQSSTLENEENLLCCFVDWRPPYMGVELLVQQNLAIVESCRTMSTQRPGLSLF